MNARVGHSLTGASFFAVASVAAGGLHYLFQLWAASQLTEVQFGELTSWVAYYSVALSVGAFAQYAANFFSISVHRLKVMSVAVMAISVIAMVFAFHSGRANAWTIGFWGLVLGILFSWFSGQAQARLAFMNMGVGVMITGVAKFVWAGATFPVEEPSLELAWAIALAYCPALIFMAIVMFFFAASWPDVKKESRPLLRGLGSTALLSFSSVFIPQMDIIAVNLNQTTDVIGEFAKISLLYKAVFFGFLIFAQWLLPHQLSEEPSSPGWAQWLSASRWRILGLSLLLGCVAFASSVTIGVWLNPAIQKQFGWILLSSLNMVLLTNLFFFIQVSTVKEHLLRPTLILAGLVLEVLIASLLKLPVTPYLGFVVACNVLLWLFLSTHQPKTRRAL